MKNVKFYLISMILIFLSFSCQDDLPFEEEVTCEQQINMTPMNEIQVIGSHNSYKIKTADHIIQLLVNSPDLLPQDFDPGSWDYGHVSLREQLDLYQVRSFELDVYRDPDGGLFYYRKGDAFLGLDPDSGEPELLEPGLKLLHFPDFDYLSHHLTFKDALSELKSWSSSHPGHLPITILVEAKEDSPDDLLPGYGLTSTMPFNSQGLAEIEEEISQVFQSNMDQLFTPDQLQGSYNSVNAAVKAGNWPALEAVTGKFIFVLLGPEQVVDTYASSFSNIPGSLMFPFSETGDGNSAYVKIDDPIANFDLIQQKVKEGYVVRTRADADTYEARNGDYARMMAAINSGAQIISTDYYRIDPRAMESMTWTDYEVHFQNRRVGVVSQVNGSSESLACAVTE